MNFSSGLTIERTQEAPFFLEDAEGDAFIKAFRRAELDQFEIGFLLVKRRDQLIATVPFFLMHISVGTLLPPGIVKKLVDRLSLKFAFVGHPSADFGRIQGEISTEVLQTVNVELFRSAPFLCYKGFTSDLPFSGLIRATGLPVPVLQVKPDYWESLKHKLRTDLKRKLKRAQTVTVRELDGLPDQLVNRVYELYEQTYQHAEIHFEHLNRDYFVQTAPLSKYLLCFEGDQLIGFHQLLCDRQTMYCKYVGMDYAKNRQYGLYFVLMIEAINLCIRNGIPRMDFGVTGYQFKRYLGAQSIPTSNYFGHRNPLMHFLLKGFRFLLEPSAKELA